MSLSPTEALRDALSPSYYPLYLLVALGLLLTSVSVEVWAGTLELLVLGDVSGTLEQFVDQIVPWGLLAVVGVVATLAGGVAVVRKAVRDAG